MSNEEKVTSNIPTRGGKPGYRPHGTGIRGGEFPPHSSLFEGRFGRIFRTLPAANFSVQALHALAEKITAPHEDKQTPETEEDDEENIGTSDRPGIPAGYTYLGQFIDHDLTFDPASSLQVKNDPEALIDFRTPRFDLDSVYGRGPDDQPYLYADDGLHLLLGKKLSGSAFDPNTRDLPRNTPNSGEPARALIGDPRNDENTIVSQLHSTVLRFHNRIVDFLTQRDGHLPSFETAQQEVRWHYQWVILHDFLPRIIGWDILFEILPELKQEKENREFTEFEPNLKVFKWKKEPFIPVEFSAAAYRFGHSIIRPIYRLNTNDPGTKENPGRRIIFPSPDGDVSETLTGFRTIEEGRAVDWTLFFDIIPLAQQEKLTPKRVQPSYKLDTSLVNPLGTLPNSVATVEHSLAARNLLRGLRLGLPSGQAVAKHLRLPVIPDDQLRVGKATAGDAANNPLLTSISPEFRNRAPLWYYILAEAQLEIQKAAQQGGLNEKEINHIPTRLGPVGGRIVGEVFVGLLFGDSHSYLRQYPGWKPIPEFRRTQDGTFNPNGDFGVPELILQAKESV